MIQRLAAEGMSENETAAKASLFARAVRALGDLSPHGAADAALFWVPGRIEFLGKHTDYAGGRSLLCAVERGFCVASVPRKDRRVRVRDARTGDTIELHLGVDATSIPGRWANYAVTVARRIARNFEGPLVGADIAFVSDLPVAAGMSSSSALVVGLFLALSDANRLAERDEYRRNIPDREALAGYLGCVETGLSFGDLEADRGVGTFGGSEDHTAILCGVRDSLVQYSFCPVRRERAVPLPARYAFVIASSGVAAEKTAGALERYNEVSRKAQSIAELWSAAHETRACTLGELAADPATRDALRTWLAAAALGDSSLAPLPERLDQFVLESETIVPGAADALARGDLARLGTLVDESMRNATTMLHNQVPETIHLASAARKLGAVAASAFGAGFGGSVWALVEAADAERVQREWKADYLAHFPRHSDHAQVFVTRAGPPAVALQDASVWPRRLT